MALLSVSSFATKGNLVIGRQERGDKGALVSANGCSPSLSPPLAGAVTATTKGQAALDLPAYLLLLGLVWHLFFFSYFSLLGRRSGHPMTEVRGLDFHKRRAHGIQFLSLL